MAAPSTSTSTPASASTSSSASASSSKGMHPLAAKTAAAATGATLTALTMTPFDVIKTRMQTQPPPSSSSGAGPSSRPANMAAGCCQPAHSTAPCVRRPYSSLALGGHDVHAMGSQRGVFDFRPNGRPASAAQVVCVWDRQGVRHAERVTGFWDAARKVWGMEGVRGLWKGVGTTLVIAVPSQTLYMVTYDNLRRRLPLHDSPVAAPLAAGVVARTLVSSLSSPLELLRTRLQATPPDPATPHTLTSVLRGIRTMTERHGVRSLWRGLGPTLWRDVPFSGVYWAGYESVKSRLRRRGFEGAPVAFVSGAVSGTTAAMLTLPFDVLKTRKQALQEAAVTHMRGTTTTATFPLLREIVRAEGPRALFAGLTPRIAKIAPACGIMIACYEGIEKYIDVRILE